VKVFYHNDNDGRCAAFLFWQWCVINHKDTKSLGNFMPVTREDFIEMDYGKNLPWDKIRMEEQIYFLDFHPEKFEDYKYLRENTWLYIIDHHKTMRSHLAEMDQNIKDGRAYAAIINESACGAMLVAKCCLGLTKENMPYFIELVDDWDRWQFKHGAVTKAFNVGSKCHDTSPFGGFWQVLYNDHIQKEGRQNFLLRVCDEGNVVLQLQAQEAVENIRSLSFPVEFHGYKCLAINRRYNSSWFASEPDYDVYLPFAFNGKNWTVSLYSSKVDVSNIAKEYGGADTPVQQVLCILDYLLGVKHVKNREGRIATLFMAAC
jgi:hypothetical protein